MIINFCKISLYYKHKIAQNAIANGIRTFLQILIAFVGNYFIVRMASKEQLGIWALVFVFANFLNLADFGVSSALIRYIANDEKNRSKYFWSSVWFYLGIGSLGILVLFVIKASFGEIFFRTIEPNFWLLMLTFLGTLFTLLSSAVTNTLNGLQRMKRSSALEVMKSFIHYFLILTLFHQVGILAFGIGFLTSNILALVVGWIILTKRLKLPFSFFDLKIFYKLFNFGIKSFGIQIVNQIKGAWLKLLTSNLFGVEFVTYTDYSEKIIGYFRQLLLSVIIPLMPAASNFYAKKDFGKLKKLYKTSLLAMLGIGLSSCLGFVLILPMFIKFWLGDGFELVITSTQIISFAVFFNLLTGPGYSVLQGIGRQIPLLVTAVLAMFLFLILTTLFSIKYGFNGIFIGNAIAEAIVTFEFLIWIWKKKPIR